jgi:hypothetical protein
MWTRISWQGHFNISNTFQDLNVYSHVVATQLWVQLPHPRAALGTWHLAVLKTLLDVFIHLIAKPSA